MPALDRLLTATGIFLVLAAGSGALAAQDAVEARLELLAKEEEAVLRGETANAETRTEYAQRLANLGQQVTPLMLEQAKLDMEEARVRFESARIDLQTAQRQLAEITASILQLQAQLQQQRLTPKSGAPEGFTNLSPAELEALIGKQRQLEAFENKRLKVREAALETSEERLRLTRQWLDAVEERYRRNLEESQQDALEAIRERLSREQKTWLSRAADWRSALQELESDAPERKKSLIQSRIRDAEERAQIASREIRFAEIEGSLASLQITGPEQKDAPALKAALDQVVAMGEEIRTAVSLLTRRVEVLRQQSEVIEKRRSVNDPRISNEELGIYANLAAAVDRQRTRGELLLKQFEKQPERFRTAYEQSVRRSLAARRPLPSGRGEWTALAGDLAALPKVVAGALTESVVALGRALQDMSGVRWLVLAGALSAWFSAAFGLRRLFHFAATAAPGFVRRMSAVPASVIGRHGGLLTALGTGGLLVWLATPASPASTLLGSTLVALSLAVLLNDMSWAFLATSSRPRRRQPRLYRQLKWLILAATTLGIVALIGHSLTLSAPLVDLLDRLFMLSLLLFTVPVLEVRRLVLAAMVRRHGERYWMRVVRLLSLLAPLAVITATMVGIAGYINLARAIGGVLAVVFGVLAIWLVLNRLLREGRDLIARRVLYRNSRGTVWIKALLEPVHGLMRMLLFLSIWGAPLYFYGVGPDTPVVEALREFLLRPLFGIGQTQISLGSVLIAAIGFFAVLRGGRWLRNVTYRWAYARVADQGMRHSLSVFTHYGFVLVGFFIVLQVMGIDLTTFAIFAGALGVGIGFGLQNIANNFISGLLLLLERPLRTHDIVRVGEHEGEVTHIGMRSITVRTWDNQEVIMPNADVISNAFTNWTHHDHIVRTVVQVRVGYDSDPRAAKHIIESVIAGNPDVLVEPKPEVWLSEFADSGLLFHVQYFTDLTRSTRLAVRSEVLMAIWEGLRSEGIHIPRPQLEVRLPAGLANGGETEMLPMKVVR